jgi:drug/metabolite transporter (DMT)-like permease
MENKLLQNVKADLALLLVAAIWGSGYSILKIGTQELGPFVFMTFRSSIAALLLAVIYWKKIKNVTLNDIKAGAIAGFFLFGGFAFLSIGMQYTEASRAGFIVSLLVVIVPLLNSLMEKEMPRWYVILGVALAAFGLYFLSLKKGSGFQTGDLLVIAAAFFYASHIVAIGIFAPDKDGPSLVAIQLFVSALLYAVCIPFGGTLPVEISVQAIASVLYTAVFASALALLIQTSAQRYTSSTHTAIIFSMEPVFGALFAWILLGEVMGGKGILGAVLILAGITITELFGALENKRIRSREYGNS